MRAQVNQYGVPLYGDGQIKRYAIRAAVRRAIALREGAIPGRTTPAECAYCGASGEIHWPPLYSGKPGSWVSLVDLHFDHIEPYSKGGSNINPDNFALACKSCNSSKRDRTIEEWLGAHEWLAEAS